MHNTATILIKIVAVSAVFHYKFIISFPSYILNKYLHVKIFHINFAPEMKR